jgi:serine/threonine protein kinase
LLAWLDGSKGSVTERRTPLLRAALPLIRNGGVDPGRFAAERHRIESELGEGGMATVYLADDIKHERKVALKVLKPELVASSGSWPSPLSRSSLFAQEVLS